MKKQQYRFISSTRKHAISYNNKVFDPKNKDDNFKDTSITHSRFYNCIFPGINFEKAAVTGSLFENCKFYLCNFNNADLEFCDFRGCEFQINITDGASFNNSNFINTIISGDKLINCTFTGTYFDHSTINGVDLEFSTLEGACFQNCKFKNVDWRKLNLEYIEVINPKFTNSVLPFHQIPFMFGMLQYLVTTDDTVKVSTGNNIDDVIDKNTYLADGIEFLINEYESQKSYFPLCNIYLFGPNTDYNKAFNYLAKEIKDLTAVRDFRGIKFCCKLISGSQIFDRHKLNKLYEIITKTDQSLEEGSPEMKSFIRNIGEIRSVLYQKKQTAQMSVRLKANIGIEYSMRFSNLIHQLQRIAKPDHTDKVYTTIQLSNNSPLIIDISVEGDKCYFAPILYNLFLLTGIYSDEKISLIIDKNFKSAAIAGTYCQNDLVESISQTSHAIKTSGVDIEVLEYSIDGFGETKDHAGFEPILQMQLIE